MEICDLLKQTRIDLGLTQQGMVGEVMSVAQYSRIESGEQRIKAEDLLELLESHNYDLGYFFTKMIYSRRGKKEADWINIEFRVKSAFYDWNWKKMSFLKEQAANLTGKTALRVGGDLVAYLLDPELKDHEQLKNEVSDYFFSLDNWMDDTEAIIVFAAAIQLMKFYIAYFWLSELLDKYQQIDNFSRDQQEAVGKACVSFCQRCRKEGVAEAAKEAIEVLGQLSPCPEFVAYRLLGKYYAGLFSGEDEEAERIKEILRESGLERFVDHFLL
ncbi:helix-turn-helix domain-containing protein [Lactobacillus delbrueckii subsp. lactis]|uniref:helix-turn-helix domain-containing protein n=1 Tax=Lactobacillus delbrueckii TaxID=1584 RepID=UPI001E40B0E6|nr:helix-turn-helix transcriptional regulator [Lactobacillus delbrueckii]MCD5557814.1 helix-turn-helix domain-containing protein [Lactobacillus delbrueckii subsp. lactis]